ncbi:MAG: hypothetical protein CYPHOPRED_003404 [Cyphobasidiales sp. Tagirdzhanova-0007]|nr:MAG: hypothetical protein CYPHOPRED_003404 [Cyphobasidiales sp. Tagirdzhanova-0007]
MLAQSLTTRQESLGRSSLDQVMEEVDTLLSNEEGGDKDSQQMGGPSSVDLRAQTKKGPFPAWMLILAWITLSTAVIFQNARILTKLDFPYPITLTSIHLLFQTAFTRLLGRYTDLIPPAGDRATLPVSNDHVPSTSPIAPDDNSDKGDQANGQAFPPSRMGHLSASSANADPTDYKNPLFWKTIMPIGLLFSLSLVLSNCEAAMHAEFDFVLMPVRQDVYMFLSVSFIQIIKAASPVAVLIASFVFGLRQPNLRLVSIICSISAGVGIASYGEASFNLFGFLIQILAIAVEASRLSLIEILLSGIGLSPLQSLQAFAPVCLAFLVAMIIPVEGLEPFSRLSNLGFPLIILNSIYLIGISSIVLSLSKVVKDILIIFASAVALGTPITPLQWAG